MKKLLQICIITALLIVTCTAAYSFCVQNGNTVTFTGVDKVDGSIFVAVAGHNNGCECSYFRFLVNNTDIDKVYATILTAISLGKKVRIDADSVGDCDSAYRIYMY